MKVSHKRQDLSSSNGNYTIPEQLINNISNEYTKEQKIFAPTPAKTNEGQIYHAIYTFKATGAIDRSSVYSDLTIKHKVNESQVKEL